MTSWLQAVLSGDDAVTRLFQNGIKVCVPCGIVGKMPDVQAVLRTQLVYFKRYFKYIRNPVIQRYAKLRAALKYSFFRAAHGRHFRTLYIIFYVGTFVPVQHAVQRQLHYLHALVRPPGSEKG